MRSRTQRRGFSLIEAIVAIAILVMLAAVIMPTLIGSLDAARVNDGHEKLDEFVSAIAAFHADVNRYPRYLEYLSHSLSGGDDDICGDDIPPGLRAQWAGPYADRIITSAGIFIGIGRAQNEIIRVSGTRAYIAVAEVSDSDAETLNAEVDADNNLAAGTVQWTSAGSGFGTLRYYFSITGC